jgi:hypothetical protein
MIDWVKTAYGVAAIVAAVFATMVAWRNLGTGTVDVTPGDYFDVLARQTSASTQERRR